MGVDDEPPRREALWDPPPRPGPRRRQPAAEPPAGLSTRSKIVLGAVIGVLFAVGMGMQGDVLPGVVGGALAALLCFLVLRDVERQRAARWRQRQQR